MRRLLTITSIAALVMMMSIPSALANTTRQPISGTQQVVGFDDSEARIWMSGHIQHVRDRRVTAIQFDDGLGIGTVHATVNTNIDTTTGTGVAWGTFHSDFGGGGFEGTYRGTVHVDPAVGPVGTWKVVARGWGDAAGTQIRGTVVEDLTTGFATYTGTAFVPGDR
jgi:hypothetical protein